MYLLDVQPYISFFLTAVPVEDDYEHPDAKDEYDDPNTKDYEYEYPNAKDQVPHNYKALATDESVKSVSTENLSSF